MVNQRHNDSTAKDRVVAPELGSGMVVPELESRMVVPELQSEWLGLSVDDATIVRRFKEIDDSIANHILDYYMRDDEVEEGEELRTVTRAKRRSVMSHVSAFEYLVTLKDARVFVLRSVLSGIILEAFDEGAFFTDRYVDQNSHVGKLTSIGSG